MEPTGNKEIVIKQPSRVNGIIATAAIGGGAVATLFLIKAIKNKRDLVKVTFKKINIPQYSKAQLIEFRDVCCSGTKPKAGRSAECTVYDPKRVACEWVPKVLNYLEQTKETVFYTWRPALIAQRLYEEMNGVAFSESAWNLTKGIILGPMSLLADTTPTATYETREGLFKAISKLNIDQLRWLHNWWVDHHADGDNLYQWIGGEIGVDKSIRNAATGAMDRAGVGSKIVIDRNKIV